MRIKESKNLTYDRISKIVDFPDDYDKSDLEPRVCVVASFERVNDCLVLHFRNRSQAAIRARNIDGGREIDLIERKLSEFLGKSYLELLEAEF